MELGDEVFRLGFEDDDAPFEVGLTSVGVLVK